jgi:multisubunit Na+/H+ antiporter MnhE subunit
MIIACSIVLMIVWLFLESAFAVPTSVSGAILAVAFSLYACDWWMQSHTLRTRPRANSARRRIA